MKSIDIGNYYIASEIQGLTEEYAIKNVVMWYLYLQLNNGEPGEVSLMLEIMELKYDQVQAFKNACHESGQSFFWKQLLTYFGCWLQMP